MPRFVVADELTTGWNFFTLAGGWVNHKNSNGARTGSNKIPEFLAV